MRINKSQLSDLPVYTKTGAELGKVIDFEIDVTTHQILHYRVGRGDILKGLLTKDQPLLVSPQQVISITATKMVVDDTVTHVTGVQPKPVPAN